MLWWQETILVLHMSFSWYNYWVDIIVILEKLNSSYRNSEKLVWTFKCKSNPVARIASINWELQLTHHLKLKDGSDGKIERLFIMNILHLFLLWEIHLVVEPTCTMISAFFTFTAESWIVLVWMLPTVALKYQSFRSSKFIFIMV